MTELDPQLPQQARNQAGGEMPFDAAEIVFSRTDDRGVIQAGNSVFQRLAGYDWPDLIGAPHKIVRHPDMPKGLFYHVWARLGVGKPVTAYVKNRSRSGRHYWVMSLMEPVEGGYASTQFTPQGDTLPQIEEIYADLVRAETEDGLNPEQSAERLMQRLSELGYPRYKAFQAHSLAAEASARADRLGRPLNQMQQRFQVMNQAILQIQSEAVEMTEAFKAIRTVPMNMRIIASQLENAGGPIGAISVNYGQMLDEMASWVRTFIEGRESVFSRIRDAIQHGLFLSFAAGLKTETRDTLSGDAAMSEVGIDVDALSECLSRGIDRFARDTAESLRQVETEANRLGRSVLDMKRYVTGLSSTRMMCKIESASLSGSGNALVGIVDQLDDCQNEIEARLARIVELNTVIQSNTSMLRSLVR